MKRYLLSKCLLVLRKFRMRTTMLFQNGKDQLTLFKTNWNLWCNECSNIYSHTKLLNKHMTIFERKIKINKLYENFLYSIPLFLLNCLKKWMGIGFQSFFIKIIIIVFSNLKDEKQQLIFSSTTFYMGQVVARES